jgi:hypothetical protein
LALLSNSLYTWNNQRTARQIFMKSDTGKFYEQLLNHFTFNFHWTILMAILHEDQCVFLFISRSVNSLNIFWLVKCLKKKWITHHIVLHIFCDTIFKITEWDSQISKFLKPTVTMALPSHPKLRMPCLSIIHVSPGLPWHG